jgi:predicted permease
MRFARILRHRIDSLLRGPRIEAGLQREIDLHIDQLTKEFRASGMSETDAHLAALSEFGGAEAIRERCRDMRGVNTIDDLFRDLAYAFRLSVKSPGFTLTAVVSLALGIGANTAVFSLLDTVMLKRLPVPNPETLRVLTWVRNDKVPMAVQSGYWMRDERTGLSVTGSFPYPAWRLFNSAIYPFSALMAYAPVPNRFTVTADGISEYADGDFVSGNYFTGLGVQPLIGRQILPEDDAPGGPRVATITWRYWKRRFGGDPGVVGRAIVVNQRSLTISGVMPPGFQGLHPGKGTDLFVPMAMVEEMQPWYSRAQADNWWVQIFGRLKPGVTDEQAAAALRASLSGIIRGYAGSVADSAIPRVLLAPGARGVGQFREDWSTRLYILSAASALVLLIACVNLANLLLARAARRRREIAVRLSIGAGRGRLVRQLLTESLSLAFAGGLLGVVLAKPLSAVLMRYAGGNGPLGLDARIDLRALAFTFGVSVLTGMLFGIVPAWRTTTIDLQAAMKSTGKGIPESGGRMRFSRLLVSAQVALSVLLLVAAGLFIRTLGSLSRVDLGFQPARLLTFQTDPSRSGYHGQRLADLYARLRDKVAAIPGVESAGMSELGLIQGVVNSTGITMPGRQIGQADPGTLVLYCSDSFLPTMRIPLLLGRNLSVRDGSIDPAAAVVNESFAKRYLAGENPLGKTFALGSRRTEYSDRHPIRIVGVVKDAHYRSVRDPAAPTAYLPYQQMPLGLQQMTFAIRTVIPPQGIAGAVRRAVAEIDPTLAVAELRTQEEQIQDSLGTERLFAALVSSFGALAALLAAIGLYGVLAYAVARRASELGIRIALGASRGNVQRLVLRESLLAVALGMLVGVPAALALTRLLKSMLYGVKATDTMSFVVALVLMIVMTAIAAWAPARRAARVDPMVALRYE